MSKAKRSRLELTLTKVVMNLCVFTVRIVYICPAIIGVLYLAYSSYTSFERIYLNSMSIFVIGYLIYLRGIKRINKHYSVHLLTGRVSMNITKISTLREFATLNDDDVVEILEDAIKNLPGVIDTKYMKSKYIKISSHGITKRRIRQMKLPQDSVIITKSKKSYFRELLFKYTFKDIWTNDDCINEISKDVQFYEFKIDIKKVKEDFKNKKI